MVAVAVQVVDEVHPSSVGLLHPQHELEHAASPGFDLLGDGFPSSEHNPGTAAPASAPHRPRTPPLRTRIPRAATVSSLPSA